MGAKSNNPEFTLIWGRYHAQHHLNKPHPKKWALLDIAQHNPKNV